MTVDYKTNATNKDDPKNLEFNFYEDEETNVEQPINSIVVNEKFSDYVIYVDESGDHGLVNISPRYPLFVLAFCIFHKKYYTHTVVPSLQDFKFRHFGHDVIVLHETEIRKEKGEFNIFKSAEERSNFLNELTEIIDDSKFILISCVIKKDELVKQNLINKNPYHTALAMCLEQIFNFLQEKGQQDRLTHVLFEMRGKKEDAELELEFRRIVDGDNWFKQRLPLQAKFADKQINSAGLQLADLVARPIGLHILNPEQNNRAFNVLKYKFYCKGGRGKTGFDYDEKGLICYP
jgi:hypothetical protein